MLGFRAESSDEDETLTPVTKAQHEDDTSDITDAVANMSISNTQASQGKTLPSAKGGGAKIPTPDSTEHPALISEIGDLYLWDFTAEQFNLIEEEITVKVIGSAFNCERYFSCIEYLQHLLQLFDRLANHLG